jgi:acyl dehydratase
MYECFDLIRGNTWKRPQFRIGRIKSQGEYILLHFLGLYGHGFFANMLDSWRDAVSSVAVERERRNMGSDEPTQICEDRRPVLYLEDLHVGQRFVTGSCVMDIEAIKTFARQFDPQPFHLSEEAAKATLFGGLAASGWHTAAVTMRLMVQSGPRLAGGVIGAGSEVSWPKPTRPGDVLHVEGEVLSVRPSQSRPGHGILSMRSDTRNQCGDIVQTMTTNLIILCRPVSE